jgi:ribosomal protein S18 acetylase RimI-like enzyme
MESLPLCRFGSRELRALLQEEAAHWQSELFWDYAEVSQAVASGLDRRALTGRVAVERERPAAYCYYIQEAGRAVVGSLFAGAAFRGKGLEERLLDEVLRDAVAEAKNRRVECQTLFSTAPGAEASFVRAGFAGRQRHYMIRDLDEPCAVRESPLRLRPVRRDDLPAIAEIVYRSHEGSLDAALNLTYGSAAHCRSFVETLVLRGGCGPFETEASFVAESAGRPVGALIASRLSQLAGHVCQVSVLPEVQGRGLGVALMTRSIREFARLGLKSATLSVTVGNARAYGLYERLGFRLHKAFGAHAWARPPLRVELPA